MNKTHLTLLAALIGLWLLCPLAVSSGAAQAQPANQETLSIQIGSLEQFQHPEGFRMPIDFHWQSSLSQSLYYPDEIGLPRAMISSISYFTHFENNLPEKEIRIWVGETTQNSLYPGWAEPADLSLVFDGTLDFPSGANTIEIMFDAPYEYNGGILVVYVYRVWETAYHGVGNRFYTNNDPGVYRTRQVNEDNNILDPANPTLNSNWRVEWFPTISLQFPLQQLGGLHGMLSHNGAPLQGVTVSVQGTTASTQTDASGLYSIPYLLADTYSVEFSLIGYQTQVHEVVLSGGETEILDVSMTALQAFPVFGTLRDAGGNAVAGAEVRLEGLIDMQVVSDTQGSFSFEGVYEGSYALHIAHPEYESLSIDPVMVDGQAADLGQLTLTDLIIMPLGLQAEPTANPGELRLSWYHAPGIDFRHDAGYVYWLGVSPADANTLFGTVFRRHAVLSELRWYLSSEVQAHPQVDLWVFALDENGQPDTGNILFRQSGIPNTDDQWNSHMLPQGVVAQHGFLFGISGTQGVFIGTDDGQHPDYPFLFQTHYFCADIINEPFSAIESISNIRYNFNLRAFGIDAGEILPVKREEAPEAGRMLNGYQVYLNDMEQPIAFVQDTEMLLQGLEPGDYMAGIRAVYSSGESELLTAAFSFTGETGTAQLDAAQLLIYPVPFSDRLQLEHLTEGIRRISLTHVSGKQWTFEARGTASYSASTSQLPPGAYVLSVESLSGNVISRTIIKQ